MFEKIWKALELHSARAISWCHTPVGILDILWNTFSHTLSNLIWHVYNKMLTCRRDGAMLDRTGSFFKARLRQRVAIRQGRAFASTTDDGDVMNDDIRNNCMNDCIWYFVDIYIYIHCTRYILIRLWYLRGTPNNQFKMDVWWNNHFLDKDLESSNWNKHAFTNG